LNICALSSGSSGNAICIGSDRTKILVDAGISAREIGRRLMEIGVKPNELAGIVITHEHTDHVRGLRVLATRLDIPVYSTEETWYHLEDCRIPIHLQRVIEHHQHFLIGDLGIEAFPVPHDAVDPLGFKIYNQNTSLGIVTDLGHVPGYLLDRLGDVELIYLESNHDVDMVMAGSYPAFLKRRILGQRGHLSNDTAADFLAMLTERCLKQIVLGHLSKNNNTPQLALASVKSRLKGIGCNVGTDVDIQCCCHGELGIIHSV
jgi:phosphoribosyl 1,2-cyclic phosphodiesterase